MSVKSRSKKYNYDHTKKYELKLDAIKLNPFNFQTNFITIAI